MRNKLKNLFIQIENNYRSFVWFVIKLVFWVFVLVWLTPLLASTFISNFKPNNVTVSDFILFITAAFIIAYTYETQKMKDEMVRQTNLQQIPIIMLFIRDVREYMDNVADYDQQQKYRGKYEHFLIRIRTEAQNSNYYLGLRNVGNGAAFNIEVKSDIFEVSKYQSRFLAPSKDEQPFAIIEKGNKKIESWDKFKNSIFEISCKDISGAQHLFKYKILGIEDKRIDFIEHE